MARGVSKATERSFKRAARRVSRLADSLRKTDGAVSRAVGEEIMADVRASRQGKGVPVDEGTLRSTARVEGPNKRGETRLSFGGRAAPYAVVQHERLDFSHTVGEARYLVRGVERWEADGSAAMKALRANAEQGIRAARAGG